MPLIPNCKFHFNAQIDDPPEADSVKIFNYALTATQVKGLHNNGAATYAPSTGAP